MDNDITIDELIDDLLSTIHTINTHLTKIRYGVVISWSKSDGAGDERLRRMQLRLLNASYQLDLIDSELYALNNGLELRLSLSERVWTSNDLEAIRNKIQSDGVDQLFDMTGAAPRKGENDG